ncbi:DNA polymerase IV [Miniphocaeibacter halophilus]|uniref:DNA polymerase IV n=1 Tax=Miniphocaeibacter halophilus TaxID=2931922 RepID=A0AC61MWP9_9FIRM|nr:DNA polymerase IV [Miniphocaeibacter halophilus]QQK08251.1 DNA polymerase IV [Miniphocaeibacter halophilus]
MNDDLNFLHIDLDAFFASVEELDNPSLKGKPMVVGGRSQRGIITTANYEARKYGLHSAMPIFKAKKLCPHVIIVPTRHDKYEEMSKKVFEVLYRYSNRIEKMSIDEACLDISHINLNPTILAKKIQRDVFKSTGLTVSIGISYNKSLAKMASDWNKPQGVKIITKDMVPGILLNLPIGKIAGIGKKSEEKFHKMGIYKVKDLMQINKEMLEYHFGKLGLVVYDRIRGVDNRQVETTRKRKSIGIERTFSEDIYNKDDIKNKILEFSMDLSKELKSRKIIGKTISIKIKFNDFKVITRSITLENPRNDFEEIYHKACYLLDNIKLEKPIRLLGVAMANLQKDNIIQLSFM